MPSPRHPIHPLIQAGLLAFWLTHPQAQAQTEFQGFKLGGQISFLNASANILAGNSTLGFGAPGQAYQLQGAYSLALGPRASLNIGASCQLGETDLGRTTVDLSEGTSAGIKLRRGIAAFVEPGYALHPDTQLYGKLSLLQTEARLAIQDNDDNPRVDGTFRGYGFGLGVRHLLTPRLYLQFEFEQANYNESRLNGVGNDEGLRLKLDTTRANLGLGLQF
ncbi:outer membrane beta-barrel protein [Leptospira sp. 96542]|nr:outer membrane beta-barrel protein [Leptospira sp. 96542]